jgi:hypothetical protein
MIKASTDWGFEKSDHAAVKIDWFIPDEPVKGPGIVKVNAQILNDPLCLKEIEYELTLMLNQIPDDWDDHQKLEYMKMSIRSVMSHQNGIRKVEINTRLTELEESLNSMEQLKIKASKESELSEQEMTRRISLVDNAIISIKSDLESVRSKVA